MSTRSFIGFVNEDNKFFGIYCHYDGYPSHVGKILVEHHNSFSAAEALTEGSHIRNFDNDGTVCRFGEGDGEAEVYESVNEALSTVYDYVYVFSDQDNCWKCYGHNRFAREKVAEFDIPGNAPWETA